MCNAQVNMQDSHMVYLLCMNEWPHRDSWFNNGAQVDMQDDSGVSALITASSNGHVQAVKLLLSHNYIAHKFKLKYSNLYSHGARIDVQDNDGVSALTAASGNENTEAVKILLYHLNLMVIQL